MVMEHARQMPAQVPALPFEIAALRATEAVGDLAAGGTTPTIKDVATYLGVDHSTASRMVASAERHGLVERTPDTSDRRRITLNLSDKGEVVIEEIPQLRVQVLAEALHEWDDHDITEFRHLLERFRLTLDAIGVERLP